MSASIHTQIEIAAPASVVWDLITQLNNYQYWNPFVIRASGKAALGETLVCEPLLPGRKRPMRFEPVVTRYVPEREFAWTGVVLHPAISEGEHIFQIKPIENQRVRVVHDEIFRGVSAPLVSLLGGERTRQGFILMNEALKVQAERQFIEGKKDIES